MNNRLVKISLCMIVKDEESFIGECLEQAKLYCDEMVVVDTGSQDDTKNIALSHGAKLYEFEWCDDFSKARNESLKYATSDWILVLDADERISSSDWKNLLEVISRTNEHCFDLPQVNYTYHVNEVGSLENQFNEKCFEKYPRYTISWLTRLFKNDCGYRFEGAVHEHLYLNQSIVDGIQLKVYLHHHGQALSEDKMLDKKRRYLEIGKNKIRNNPKDYKAWHEYGVSCWNLGVIEEACEALNKAYEIDPRNVSNLISLASIHHIQKNYKDAERFFLESLSCGGQKAQAHAGIGRVYHDQGQYEKAVDHYQKEIQQNPDFDQARFWLYQSYQEMRLKKQSRNTVSACYIVKNEEDCLAESLKSIQDRVDEIIVVDTGSTDATVKVAKDYGAKVFSVEWRDDFAWARNQSLKHATMEWVLVLDADEVISLNDWEKIQQLIKATPHELFFLVQTTYSNQSTVLNWKVNDIPDQEAKGYPGYFESNLVRLFRNTPLIQFVGAVHENAYHKNPKMAGIYTDIRIHHYGKFRTEERMSEKSQLYKKIGFKKLDDMPKNPQAYYEMAVQLLELDDRQDVESYFLKSLELDENYYRTHIAYACYLHEEMRFADAIEHFSKAMSLEPKKSEAYIYTSSLLIELKKYDLALNVLKQAKVLGAKNDVAMYINEGVIHLNLENYQLAETCFEKAYTINPKHAPTLVNLALVCVKKGELNAAEQKLKEANKINDKDTVTNKILAEVLFNQGNHEEALEFFCKAHECDPSNLDVIVQAIVVSHCLKNQETLSSFEDELWSHHDQDGFFEAWNSVEQLYKKTGDLDRLCRFPSQKEKTHAI